MSSLNLNNIDKIRIKHFKSMLSLFKNNERIPDDVYNTIIVQIKKNNITNLSDLTKSKIKYYLKKCDHLDFDKYSENIYQIICHFKSIEVPEINIELENKLLTMFKSILHPYQLYCPIDRKSFLSYRYVLYKLLELLDYKEYLPYFGDIYKSQKAYQQDKIWKQICEHLEWYSP